MKGPSMEDNNIESEVDSRTAESINGAPLPTRATLRRRQNLLVQFWRFVTISTKMGRVIFRGHS
jgi:hypothetical protein